MLRWNIRSASSRDAQYGTLVRLSSSWSSPPPPTRIRSCRRAASSSAAKPAGPGVMTFATPAAAGAATLGDDRDRDGRLEGGEAAARRRKNSRIPEIGVGISAEEEDVCHKGTRAHRIPFRMSA